MDKTTVTDATDVKQQLREFIVENFLFGDEQPFADSDSLLQNGIVDSTGILELVHHLEQTYAIAVEDEEMLPENLDSLDNLASYLLRKTPQ